MAGKRAGIEADRTQVVVPTAAQATRASAGCLVRWGVRGFFDAGRFGSPDAHHTCEERPFNRRHSGRAGSMARTESP